ncbi:MAG: ABC transporter ATP-binding protein [Streptosporangiaceae bacterium]
MTAPALRVSGLDAYYGTAHVLFDVQVAIEPGTNVALLGRNGAGKSTLLKSIAGADGVRRKGVVDYDGSELTKLSAHKIARHGVVLVPEDRRIFTSLTVQENIALGGSASAPGRPALGFDAMADLFPLLRSLRERRGNELSGGEQQLVAIARAVAGNPRLLLMDEPSAGLAPVILKNVIESVLVLRNKFDITMLITEQNMDFALALCEHVIVIDGGHIMYAGTKEEFVGRADISSRHLGI